MDSPGIIVSHPLPQGDEPLVPGLDWQSIFVYSYALVSLGEIQSPEMKKIKKLSKVNTSRYISTKRHKSLW